MSSFAMFFCLSAGPAQLPDGVDPLKAQASIYGDVLGACLSEEAFDGFTLWGFTDLHSWWVCTCLSFQVSIDRAFAFLSVFLH